MACGSHSFRFGANLLADRIALRNQFNRGCGLGVSGKSLGECLKVGADSLHQRRKASLCLQAHPIIRAPDGR
jgi:hypothetical protein